ncbi:MAG: glycosyltransferase family 2 protein [Bryobacteraceae bacterium]
MSSLVLACVGLTVALANAALFFRNLQLYRPPSEPRSRADLPRVSVLIPARNEERSIRAAMESVLATRDVVLELIVLDDHSDDGTSQIVREMAHDARVRLEFAPELPAGWCGKQFACLSLARLASHDILVFLDADVRLHPGGLSRMIEFLQSSKAELVSGFPHQEVHSFYERLLLPLMHFLLLGFLPMDLMRRRMDPSLGAGCGQIFVARRSAYWAAGGHAAIRESRHDGISLPRAFRIAGFRTDLCDVTSVAQCRMYYSGAEVFEGLLKNATEGVAAPSRIGVFTVLLLAGHVLPFALLLFAFAVHRPAHASALAVFAAALSLSPRIMAAARFRQPWSTAFLHPWAVLVFLGIQWYAFLRSLLGMPATWKGRFYLHT